MSQHHRSAVVAVATALGALLLPGGGHGAIGDDGAAPRAGLSPAAATGLVWADEAPRQPEPADVVVPPAPSSGATQTIVVTIGPSTP